MTKNNTTFLVVGIIILLFLILPNIQKQQNNKDIGLNVRYYDENKKEVFPEKSFFSIVTPPGLNLDYINLSIRGTVGGASYSNIMIKGASPSAFATALPTTTQSLVVGETKTLWSSGLISTSQFESMSQPVRFWVNVSAKNDYTGLTEYKQGYSDLSFASAFFGSGGDGQLVFTTSTKSYGNLVLGTDYQVSGNILYLKVDKVYQFTNFTLGTGTELRPYNPINTGAVLYIEAKDTIRIDGTVNSNFENAWIPVRGNYVQTSFSSGTINGIITTPGVANGGSGGNSGTVIGTGFNAGGSQGYGFGGGGAGGPVCAVYCTNYGGAGGQGGSPIYGGTGGRANAQSSGTAGASGASGSNSGGGGGAAQVQGKSSAVGSWAQGGNGGANPGASGTSGSMYQTVTLTIAAGGGGGAGGYAGYSGVHFYTKAPKIYFTGTINTVGTNGFNGGSGGNGVWNTGGTAGAGGGGGGGGGGNAGNIILSYDTIIVDTGIKNVNGGSEGVGGTGGSSGSYQYSYTHGSPGSSGTSGTIGTSNVGQGFCIACFFDNFVGE